MAKYEYLTISSVISRSPASVCRRSRAAHANPRSAVAPRSLSNNRIIQSEPCRSRRRSRHRRTAQEKWKYGKFNAKIMRFVISFLYFLSRRQLFFIRSARARSAFAVSSVLLRYRLVAIARSVCECLRATQKRAIVSIYFRFLSSLASRVEKGAKAYLESSGNLYFASEFGSSGRACARVVRRSLVWVKRSPRKRSGRTQFVCPSPANATHRFYYFIPRMFRPLRVRRGTPLKRFTRAEFDEMQTSEFFRMFSLQK